ncbi:hypothetical protein EJ08DRAFT_368349 [Tothia fuscella]|uniref:Uncharacterized protein n=1 Tax=Tothia fuscella TaxID=1048955 RepID=A0A9P4NLY4_9PEZI|nr:hypothetical protein EJ08DRAFT_368349 [Tothia fuscella]
MFSLINAALAVLLFQSAYAVPRSSRRAPGSNIAVVGKQLHLRAQFIQTWITDLLRQGHPTPTQILFLRNTHNFKSALNIHEHCSHISNCTTGKQNHYSAQYYYGQCSRFISRFHNFRPFHMEWLFLCYKPSCSNHNNQHTHHHLHPVWSVRRLLHLGE